MKEETPKLNQKIAFFSLSTKLSLNEQNQKKIVLWNEYLANGGDSTAIPGFYDFGVEDGLVWCPSTEEFRSAVMNKSRNPAERLKG